MLLLTTLHTATFRGEYQITLIYVRGAIFENNEIAPKRYLFSSNMAGYANKSGEKKVRAAEKKIGCRGVYNQTVMFIGHKSIWAFCENVASKQYHSDMKWKISFGNCIVNPKTISGYN